MSAQKVARAAFRLARMTYEAQRMGRDIDDSEVDRLFADLGAEPVAIALRVQAELMHEEAAALEAYGAIRMAKEADK